MSRHTRVSSLRAPCTTCGSPAFDYCIDEDGNFTERSHPARVAAAKEIPLVTKDQLAGLDRLAVNPAAVVQRIVIKALVEKRWARPIDPPVGPTKFRLSRRPVQRHVVTEAGQNVRRAAGRCA